MLSSKKWLALTFFLLLAVFIQMASHAIGSPRITEETMLSQLLSDNLKRIKILYRYTHEMIEEARPFQSAHHQARYRFAPSDRNARTLLSLARKIHYDFNIVKGILCYPEVKNRDALLKQIQDSCDTISTYGKRALRARKDGNFALYLAAAQGVQKELKTIDTAMRDLEEAINASIRESDSRMEDL